MKMKPIASDRSPKKNGLPAKDEDNVRYKLNLEYFNKLSKPRSPAKSPSKSPREEKKPDKTKESDNNVRYKLAEPILKLKPLDIKTIKHNENKTIKRSDNKTKARPKIKVNFWSSKQNNTRLNKTKEKVVTNRRHTVAVTNNTASKAQNSVVKVRKRVSFLPSPLFLENHVPMVTVPDDLTIALNEEEANELRDDLNEATKKYIGFDDRRLSNSPKKLSSSSTTQTSPSLRGTKRKHSPDDLRCESELEFFSKYVVQKLRKMETNQRIYSENLINTVLMLGQFGTLNGKSKITDV